MVLRAAKAGTRRVLVGLLEATGTLPAIRRRSNPDRAAILRYHSVSYFDGPARLYRSASIAVTPETFERQMRFLSDWYQVLPLGSLVDCLLQGKAFPPRAVAITFDDGYRDNFVHAWPILRAYQCPATVYVTSGAVGDGWRFWLSRVRACILATSRARIDLGVLGRFDFSSTRAREAAVQRLTAQLKRLSVEERDASIDRLVVETGYSSPVAGSNQWFMDWSELRAMADAGIEIGAHTHSHPILTRLTDAAAANEIQRSRHDLEARLGRPVRHFAYPNGGGVINHDARIAHLVQSAGFDSAATSVNGVLRLGADPYRISRLGVAERHGVDGLALNLERDRLFSFGQKRARPGLLLVGPPPDAPGGISTCVRTVLDSPISARFSVTHLCPTGASGFHQPRAVALLAMMRAVARCPVLLAFRRPAIVQVHTAYGNDFWRSAPFVLLAAAAGVPSVLIIHGSRFDRAYEEASGAQRSAIRFVLRRASAIHVRGEYWRGVLQAIVPGRPVHLLPTTTELVEEPAADPALKWRAPAVLFVGGTAALKDNVRKGLPELLAVVPRLVAEVPHARVQIVGPTSADQFAEWLHRDAAERVQFLGSLSRAGIKVLYEQAAIFVLPSHAEGMPNAILEAMAHGLPIVATRVGSIPEVVEHGAGGFLVTPGNGDELLTALMTLLTDPAAARRMGDYNRTLVRDRFTNRHTVERLLEAYAALGTGPRVSSFAD